MPPTPPATDPTWRPDEYLAFAAPRLQPALDLLARLGGQPQRIVDLGCGPGSITVRLRERWPRASIAGVDRDPAMLAEARTRDATIDWQQADLAAWQPAVPCDLIFSNAALHWLPDHPPLFARLAAALAPDGQLAIQMPDNFAAPAHRLVAQLAGDPRFAPALARAGARMGAVLPPDAYLDLLAAHNLQGQVWQVIYWQTLTGSDPVLRWLQGSTLVPYRAALGDAAFADFCAQLAPRLVEAYPAGRDGTVRFPFRRLFIHARR